jgi:hypothetical protein
MKSNHRQTWRIKCKRYAHYGRNKFSNSSILRATMLNSSSTICFLYNTLTKCLMELVCSEKGRRERERGGRE